MDITRFHGVVPAMATPFKSNYELDLDRVAQLIEGYIAAGVHGISVAGSQGEFFALSAKEHLQLLEKAIDATNGRVPVYAGTGAVTTRQAIELTKAAESMGADLALVITPYFAQPSQEELLEHYTSVAKATRLPVMLYNNPPRTKVNVLPKTLVRCMQGAENIVGIKDSAGDLTQSIEFQLLAPRASLLFSGRDTIALAMMRHGAQGTISPAANVFPELMVAMYEACRSGDHETALRISNIFAPLRAAWALGSFPVVIKEAMALAGRNAGPTRPPIMPLTEQARAEVDAVVRRIAMLASKEGAGEPAQAG
ncbi:4-hydroxy-tetrahydrodipicolinate synthase [Pusillimonas noertemannii]|uniref:4-hydroxy-tetrahydrodipicolinate synthase n=1 Tax=Pusillimonas noertemannii TaxID=305977 RepID=A0A2U1CH31_9BURK|nr:4-hydroxy-tetrahydrodipicolinate synthase [Pusillimonas noertemannii]NYT70619.1 4-hydroxy-tetrahydrodipicolinate synthase [Pusillimonas noertemannii]PVY60228.1 4-hydroxy-tetrahydrodipicolinate synthase [Pusillimonas noertemannii]TFL07984.1 4-hydroxy-tetrahydrodipicolinate synthase [Pusillimonas noertemannii]